MKKWFFGEKKHLDEEKIEQEKADLKNLRWIMDHGTVEQYQLYIRGVKSDISEDEMYRLTAEFHQRRAERQQQLRPR